MYRRGLSSVFGCSLPEPPVAGTAATSRRIAHVGRYKSRDIVQPKPEEDRLAVELAVGSLFGRAGRVCTEDNLGGW
jgi:hypothetical protein